MNSTYTYILILIVWWFYNLLRLCVFILWTFPVKRISDIRNIHGLCALNELSMPLPWPIPSFVHYVSSLPVCWISNRLLKVNVSKTMLLTSPTDYPYQEMEASSLQFLRTKHWCSAFLSHCTLFSWSPKYPDTRNS